MAKKQRKYDMEYKIQAVKLAKEIGGAKAAAELESLKTPYMHGRKPQGRGGWTLAPAHTPQTAMNLAEELASLRRQAKEQEKEIRRLKEENEFLEEASAFFTASRRKPVKSRE